MNFVGRLIIPDRTQRSNNSNLDRTSGLPTVNTPELPPLWEVERPTTPLSDIRMVDAVIKGGKVMYPSELNPAMGIRARYAQLDGTHDGS